MKESPGRQSEMMKLILFTENGEWEPEESQLIFDMVTDLWVTMCGFSSYASEWMEKWREETKKSDDLSKNWKRNLMKTR